MKRPRPYIPIGIRIQVAARQYRERFGSSDSYLSFMRQRPGRRKRLTWLVAKLFPGVIVQLDHDPALILRLFDRETGKYTPDANDPAWLVWREKAQHQEKTTGRRPGASRTITTKGSDIGLKTKFARLEGKPKRRLKIQSRGFQKRGEQSQ